MKQGGLTFNFRLIHIWIIKTFATNLGFFYISLAILGGNLCVNSPNSDLVPPIHLPLLLLQLGLVLIHLTSKNLMTGGSLNLYSLMGSPPKLTWRLKAKTIYSYFPLKSFQSVNWQLSPTHLPVQFGSPPAGGFSLCLDAISFHLKVEF